MSGTADCDEDLLWLTLNFQPNRGYKLIGPYPDDPEGREDLRNNLRAEVKAGTKSKVDEEFWENLHDYKETWIEELLGYGKKSLHIKEHLHAGEKTAKTICIVDLEWGGNKDIVAKIKSWPKNTDLALWTVAVRLFPGLIVVPETVRLEQVVEKFTGEKGLRLEFGHLEEPDAFVTKEEACAYAKGYAQACANYLEGGGKGEVKTELRQSPEGAEWIRCVMMKGEEGGEDEYGGLMNLVNVTKTIVRMG